MSLTLLAIDTAGDACSVALYRDGSCLQRIEHAPRRHSELIFSMLTSLLADAGVSVNELDALAFSRGPGSFTGVRIATSVIQGIAFAADLPVVPVSTLAALAHQAYRMSGAHYALVALDARMAEVYWATYHCPKLGTAIACTPDAVSAPTEILMPNTDQPWYGIGSGWQPYVDELTSRIPTTLSGYDGMAQCQAWDVALLGVEGYQAGDAVRADQALPLYVRDQVTS